MELGQIIKKVRKDAGKRQDVLTEIFGCDQSAVSRIENSKQSVSLKRLKAFAEYFGLNLNKLLENEIEYLKESAASLDEGDNELSQIGLKFFFESSYWMKLRIEHRMSTADLAREIGHPNDSTVLKWEKGVTYPGKRDLQKLLVIFDADIDDYVEHLLESQKRVLSEKLREIKN